MSLIFTTGGAGFIGSSTEEKLLTFLHGGLYNHSTTRKGGILTGDRTEKEGVL